jgi:predicted DNA-binding transcriptional regulator AlpA
VGKTEAAEHSQDCFLTTGAVLRRYGISRTTLWAWRRRGHIPPPLRLGTAGVLRWRVADLQEWERRKLTTSPAA